MIRDDRSSSRAGESGDLDLATELLRAAGRLPEAPPELEARARAAVEARWRERFAAPAQRRRWRALALPLAASLAVAVVLWWRGDDSAWRGASPPVGADVAATGVVQVVRGVAAVSLAVTSGTVVDTPTATGDSALRSGASDPPRAGDPVAPGSRLATGAGGLLTVELADPVARTSLRLAPHTRLVWLGGEQLEFARGTLYVDRRRDPGAAPGPPLEIRTAFGTVTDLGTQFELAVDATGLRARVREGAVTLSRDDERHLAAAGTELRAGAGSGVERRAVEPWGDTWSWAIDAAPAIELDGRTLGDALAWIGRETGCRVVWPDPALHDRAAGERLAGALALGPAKAAEIVPRLFGLEARILDGTILIEEPR